jgi:hypothetical protein
MHTYRKAEKTVPIDNKNKNENTNNNKNKTRARASTRIRARAALTHLPGRLHPYPTPPPHVSARIARAHVQRLPLDSRHRHWTRPPYQTTRRLWLLQGPASPKPLWLRTAPGAQTLSSGYLRALRRWYYLWDVFICVCTMCAPCEQIKHRKAVCQSLMRSRPTRNVLVDPNKRTYIQSSTHTQTNQWQLTPPLALALASAIASCNEGTLP